MLNGVTKSAFTGTSSFVLTVSASPCYSAIATAYIPVAINVVAFAAVTTYGGFTSFSYTPSLGTTCGDFTYTADITPVASVTHTTFVI